MADRERLLLLMQVAQLYYDAGTTQEEIAARLRVSRPTVSRLLKEAREEGIVQITIRNPFGYVPRLESGIHSAFPYIKKVMVLGSEGLDYEAVLQELGRAAAEYLAGLMREGDIVGLSWGNTMEAVTQHLPGRSVARTTAVQLNGGVGRVGYGTNAQEVVQRFARAFQAQAYFLPLPAIVDSPAVRDALLSDRHTAHILELGRKANIAAYSIGFPDNNSVLVQAGYFSPADMARLKARGAVGDIASRYFTVDGRIVDEDLDRRTIGLPIHELGTKDHAIGIAGGVNKAAGILGALRGRFLNVLITDEVAATEVLRLHREGGKAG